jgi:hypothetical protein
MTRAISIEFAQSDPANAISKFFLLTGAKRFLMSVPIAQNAAVQLHRRNSTHSGKKITSKKLQMSMPVTR